MRPRNRSVRRAAFGLVLASFTVAACSGVAAPATGPGGTQGQGSGSVGATNAASQGTSDGQGGGAVTLPDPCSLLTPDEIRAQFTFDVAPGIGSSAPGSGATSPDCNWSPVDYHPSFGGVQLIVEKFDEGYFDFRRGPNSKDVAGLGDEAYFIQPTNPFTLLIKKGNLHFTLTVQAGSGSSDSPETLQQRVITLATNVLAHL
jgi:hypothetical protein